VIVKSFGGCNYTAEQKERTRWKTKWLVYLSIWGPFKILCQSGKIKNTQGHRNGRIW